MKNLLSSKFLTITSALVFVLAIFIWDTRYKGDTQPFNGIRHQVFINSELTNSDGHDNDEFCFGLGGGIEQSHPCVYIVHTLYDTPYPSQLPKVQDCFLIDYLAEANYGPTSFEVPDERRYFPFMDAPYTVKVCGIFVPNFGRRTNGNIADLWYFKTDTRVGTAIENDLKRRGYKW
jgi:hypothetical protein